MASPAKKSSTNTLGHLSLGVGIGLLLLAGIIFIRLFHDSLRQEVRYAVTQLQQPAALTPPNTDFAIVIDKIEAVAAIVKDIDPYNSQIYQLALRDGVAHARGTGVPGGGGNIFLFAHSSEDLLTAERYNSVFYLMHHLNGGDLIKVWYQKKEYHYLVKEKLSVSPTDTKYLTVKAPSEQLTLMTCWPPGTTLKRLIIVAELVSS